MRHLTAAILTAIACLGIAIPSAGAQTAKNLTAKDVTAKDLAGAWILESDTTTTTDGRTIQPFGAQPIGMAIFDSAGHFAIVNARSDLPKFASNNRMHGTAAENEAIVHGSFAFFGTYTMANGVMVQHIEGGTWPAWMGTDQKRTIASYTGDEQTWTTVPSFGGRSELRWKRVK